MHDITVLYTNQPHPFDVLPFTIGNCVDTTCFARNAKSRSMGSIGALESIALPPSAHRRRERRERELKAQQRVSPQEGE